MSKNRKILFGAIVAVLVLGNLFYWVYSRWGLITIDADSRPVGEVIRKIEQKAGLAIRTDLPADAPITMHVHLVTLQEALETLAVASDARWRLAYVFGPDRGAIQTLLGSMGNEKRPEGWRTAFYPLPALGDMGDYRPADPRKDLWTVKEPAEKTLQAYLDQGARNVSATFFYPESWNPAVASAPSSGKVSSVAAKVAKLARGQEEELILLTKTRGGDGDDEADEERGGGGWMGGGGGGGRAQRGSTAAPGSRAGNFFEGMEERARAEVAKLPPEERAAATAQLEERKQFFEAMRNLTPEQRREKMDDMRSRPDVQERMDSAKNERDARLSPAQRQQRAQKYVQRRQQMRDGAAAK